LPTKTTTISKEGGAPWFCQWEIWQASWEHEDGTKKDRPVLILSSTKSANSGTAIWVAKFTKTFIQGISAIKFTKGDPSFTETGLREDCYLYPCLARKIEKSALIRKRGRLPILSAALIGALIKQSLKFTIE
jgi:mRNA-degrading endonuclease toxin of MazEF toxin-antitoxin module